MEKINTTRPQEGRSRDWLPAGKKEQHQMPFLLKAASLLSTSKKYFKVKNAFIYSPLFFMDTDLGARPGALSPQKCTEQLLHVRSLDRPDLRFYSETTPLDGNIQRDCVFFPSALSVSVCCRKFEGSSSSSNGSATVHEIRQFGPHLKFKWRLIGSAKKAGPRNEPLWMQRRQEERQEREEEKEEKVTRDEE